MSRWYAVRALAVLALAGGLDLHASADGPNPWADSIASYDPGTTPVAGFTDPSTALGAPARFTNDPNFPSVVSVFSPPFLPEQIVSIGEGGYLELEFDEPIRDDPAHRFGADFIVFGNGGFLDTSFPAGQVGTPAMLFGLDEMRVAVSADGVHFADLAGPFTEGFFPTQGFLDSGPYDPTPGTIPTDFTSPIDPALTPDDFAGLTLGEILTLYDGSGGGTPIDLTGSGLVAVSFIRIEVLDDGNPNTQLNVEIDALATVPEPSSMVLLGCLVLAGIAGKKR